MVALLIVRELLHLFPGLALVVAGPEHDVAAGIVGLRAEFGGSDHAPGTVGFDVERAMIVVVVGSRDRAALPFLAGPTHRLPLARTILWTGFKSFTRREEDHRPARVIEVHVLEIRQQPIGTGIISQRGIVGVGKR